MSTLTSLISAGGGGGGETNIITDPKKLLRTSFSRAYIKGAAVNIPVESRSAGFYTTTASTTNMAATVATASSNTYVTLLNASNTDGGYLHFVVSPAVATAGQSVTVKITVDGGTAVELVFQPTAINTNIGMSRMFVGGGFQTSLYPTSTSYSAQADVWNSYDANLQFGSGMKNQEDATNFVYISNSNSFQQGYIQSDLNILRGMPYQRLYFTSSLLVEVKQSTFNNTSENHRALCLYSLI